MRVKKIFKGAIAGFITLSLMFSSISSVAASQRIIDLQAAEAGRETEQKAGNQSAQNLGEKTGNQPGQNPAEKAGNQSGQNLGEKTGNQPGQNPVEKAGNPSVQNPEGEQENHLEQNPQGEQKNHLEHTLQVEQESQSVSNPGEKPGNEPEQTLEKEQGSQSEQNLQEEQESQQKEATDAQDLENLDIQQEESLGQDKEHAKENLKEGQEDDAQVSALENLQTVDGNVVIDGNLSDWAKVEERASGTSDTTFWKAAYSPDKRTLYISYSGMASSEWDYGFASINNRVKFAYADGYTGADDTVFVNAWTEGAEVKDAYWGNVPGAAAAVVNEANGNNPGVYRVEFSIPLTFLHSTDFVLEFGGVSLKADEIQQLNGKEAAEDAPAVYHGITIDGGYTDWAAVAKTEANCPNEQHKGCISQVAAVFDGDWFYIYIKDGKGSNASSAGTHSNGKFAITSDLGYETDIQLTTAPAVNGVNGAQVAYVGSEWEIAIPKDQLPKYRQNLSFGLYLQEPLVKNIMNLQEDNGNNLENLFQGIVYDGAYEDWEDYVHTTIEYATAGSQESQIDAKGALYSSGDKLYGHVVTGMKQHLQEAGGEFTSAVTIAFNQKQTDLQNGTYDANMVFYPRFVTVDSHGTINWNPKLSGLSEGTYEFYIASRDAWGNSGNINNVNEMDQMYGRMIMTLGKDGKDEMEFYLELPMIAKKLGVDETELKQIAGQFGRIGQQWIYTAGASSAPLAGVTLCVAAVGLALWYKKKYILQLLAASVK